MKKEYLIRLEEPKDYDIVENLTRESFWNIYKPGANEHYVLHRYRLREDFVQELDFVMEKDGEIIGHIMYAKAELQLDNGNTIPILTFGPLSIASAYQKQGYGTALIEYSAQKAKEMGFGAIAILGNIEVYKRSGFVMGSEKGIYYADMQEEMPFFLVKELKLDFLQGKTGRFYEPDGYHVDDKEVEEFDKKFAPKEKLVLPGQLG